MFDEYISWRGHTKTVEMIITKNIGLLYCARQVLTAVSIKTIRFSDIHLQLNYAWASRSVAKLKKIHWLKMWSICLVFSEDIRSNLIFTLSHTQTPLLQRLFALNIFQKNIFQRFNFLYQFNNNQIPNIFYDI